MVGPEDYFIRSSGSLLSDVDQPYAKRPSVLVNCLQCRLFDSIALEGVFRQASNAPVLPVTIYEVSILLFIPTSLVFVLLHANNY